MRMMSMDIESKFHTMAKIGSVEKTEKSSLGKEKIETKMWERMRTKLRKTFF